MLTELNGADDCSKVIEDNTLSKEHRQIAAPPFSLQQNIGKESDIELNGTNQDLNYQNSISIIQHLKETKTRSHQPKTQSLTSIKPNWYIILSSVKSLDT